MVIAVAIVSISSCQKYKREIESLNNSKDSIQSVVSQRDASILEYVGSMNEINDKLDSIKQVQKLVKVELTSNSELEQSQKDKILNDLALLNNLIEQNKKAIASLQSKLKKSDMRVAELEKMLENLNSQIEEKDVEIAGLSAQLEKMKIDISSLNEKIGELNAESQNKSVTIEQQKNEMNTAYYCFGTKDELIANNIVEKTGGVIGLGKTLRMKKDFNKEYFMKVDIRKFNEVVLGAKKAEFVSTHTEGSYHFVGEEKNIEKLVIDNATDFWSASRYMVIVVDVK
jgi:uncharacterized coiled-coil protein SlyX